MDYITNSPAETEAVGAALAAVLKPGAVIAYQGDLGAGKTAFTRGVACGLGAISVEHLLKISDQDIQRLATSDTVGVVLPATAFSLKEEYAPARKMIDAGCAVALATDFNPGSCNTQSIPLVIALANIYCKMTMAETLCALTLNGACAIGRGKKIGTVEVGKQADLLIHNVDTLQDLCYNFVSDTVDTVLKKGNIVLQKNN